MSTTRYRSVVLGALVLILAAVNHNIWQRENVLRDGQTLFLELAPVDPRSLMQGDYMALRFAVSQKVQPTGVAASTATDGYVVVNRDDHHVGVFERIYRDGEMLAVNQARVRYRLRKFDVRIVTNAFFFKEGTAADYAGARYGELRVAGDGEALLVGMRDKDLNVLGGK